MYEVSTPVVLDEGLHTRPSTQFAKIAKGFDCDIEVVREGKSADGKSSVKVMLLGVKQNECVILRANGKGEKEAVTTLCHFVSHEQTDASVLAASNDSIVTTADEGLKHGAKKGQSGAFTGVSANGGCNLAPAFFFIPEPIVCSDTLMAPDRVPKEKERFKQTFDALKVNLQQRLKKSACDEDTVIVEALLEVSQEDEYEGEILRTIDKGFDASASTYRVGFNLAKSFQDLDGAYMQARAEDIKGLTRQLVLALQEKEDSSLSNLEQPSIVVADDLSALDFAKADVTKISGLVCMKGSETSHVAIMARAHGIPAVLGLSKKMSSFLNSQQIAMNGATGEVWFDPSAQVIEAILSAMEKERAKRQMLESYKDVSPITSDGKEIIVGANLSDLAEITPAIDSGAMGVGLFRTELLFMGQGAIPSEDRQTEIYTKLATSFLPKPVIIRTLDVGGDKPVPGVDCPHEDNPFLGWRGLRMCLDRQDIFKPQLKALLRASVVGNLEVMFPMVSDIKEIHQAKHLVDECKQELTQQGVAFGEFKIGIMIETPAAVFTASELAKEVDFFSIGTNDLTQYVMAADRLNPRLSHLYCSDHPAVLEAIRLVCLAAEKNGIPVGVCGEAASKAHMIPMLIEFGVKELSMSPSSILETKKLISEM